MAKQYETVVKLQFLHDKDAKKYMAMQEKLQQSSTHPRPIVFRSKKQRHHDVFFKESEYAGEHEMFQCFVGLPADYERNHFMSAEMKIVDIPRYEHFDDQEYPENSSYFMYGDKENVFLFHVPSRSPDFFQMIQLDGPPDGIGDEEATDVLLRHGTEVEILGVPGSPVIVSGEVQDLLMKNNFDVTFVGINGKVVKSEVKVARKIWFAASTRTLKSDGKEE